MSEYLMYLRKSRQDDPNETVEEVLRKHEIQLQEYALRTYGYRLPEKDIYREVVSGEMIEDRPQVNLVLKKIEDPAIKGVIVIEPQRLTRGDMLDCGTVEHLFRYTNTLVVTPPKTYDLSDKYDRKLFEMELSRGSDFLDYTKEILERGRKASTKRGNWIHSIPPYGYEKVKISKEWTLTPNEKEAPYVQMIFSLYLDGLGCDKIARKIEELGAVPRNNKEHFEPNTLRQMLRNPVYIGKLKVDSRSTIKVVEEGKLVKKRTRNKNYSVVDGKHPAIIDPEIFEKVQQKIGENPRTNSNCELKNIYAGIMKCAICGKAIMIVPYSNSSKRVDRYKCRNSIHCHNISHRYDEINDAIVVELKRKLKDFETTYHSGSDEDKSMDQSVLDNLVKQYNDIDKKVDAICKYLEDGIYTTEMFVSRKKALEDEKKRLSDAIAHARSKLSKTYNIESKIISLHKALDLLNDDTISAKIKNDFLKSFIKVIYYKKDSKDITIDIILK